MKAEGLVFNCAKGESSNKGSVGESFSKLPSRSVGGRNMESGSGEKVRGHVIAISK